MDKTWLRIDAELKERGRDWKWLRRELGYDRGRVHNWKARGIPPAEYASLAVALGKSVDWILGLPQNEREEETDFSPMARKLAQSFSLIADPTQQLDAYTECIAVIARATDPKN